MRTTNLDQFSFEDLKAIIEKKKKNQAREARCCR